MLDVAALQLENSSLREQLAELTAQLRSLVSGNAELAKTIARLNERVAELLAVAQRTQRKPSPPKSAEPPPAVEGDAKLAFESRPKPPELPPKTKEKKPRPPPTGRKALPRHLPLDAHNLKPDECAHCGSTALDVADVVEEEKLDVVKEHQRRRVVKRTTCRCRDCGGRTTPRSLPAPYERSKVTCDWLAWLVMTKFSMLTPLDRTRRDLKDRGVPPALTRHHVDLAKGGVGMSTVAYCSVSQEGRTFDGQLWMRPEVLPHLRALTDAVHAAGAGVVDVALRAVHALHGADVEPSSTCCTVLP